ncbi:PLP-dependent aminotransferase family protein [Rhodopirellula sp. SWK7]|uniref:MocR-like pyridoxine biosynthesis transcription factor PdxR n=1 Tax=Rhodopirellula sp. SWK7 TaxID=595460 RepID=UPI0002BF84DB|nr:PLP-dependent aminotransferase family protein [Rhodopirellula sp. SWK7]EMI41307.1 transcriptional regulator, GntR family with aminotransferase domain protein [Rhodopirellula sp. SWK7]
MTRPRKERFEFDSIQFSTDSKTPVYQQLENQLRRAISSRTLLPGDRVPSSRNFAAAVGVSRNTVLAAYEQLISEGYLESARGSGTRVAKMPPQAFEFDSATGPATPRFDAADCLSDLGHQFAAEAAWMPAANPNPKAFTPHLPAIGEFPLEVWNRFTNEQSRWSNKHLTLGDPQGYQPLRESIAQYMAVSRGFSCHADQVLITSGAQQAVTLISQLLLERNDTVWVEEPGNAPANRLLDVAGANVVPVPLDCEGIDLPHQSRRHTPPKLICVTPGGQWPMGMTMSLNRRLELIALAQRHQSWIVEDDYNSEFRYTGRPHPSLSGLDSSGRTIYMGTFSKMLFPAIRLAFLIVPPSLAKTFAYARFLQDRASPPVVQMVLHRFIESGNFVKHIRRMRSLYSERQTVLFEALQKHLGGVVEVEQPESGMHLVARGVTKAAEDKLISAAMRAKVEFHPVSMYSRSGDASGMILGFAAFDKTTIQRTVRRWAKEL